MTLRIHLGFILGLAAFGRDSLAQQPGLSAGAVASCPEAARVIRANAGLVQVPYAAVQIRGCPQEGPEIFAEMWPGRNAEERKELRALGEKLQDRRSANALFAVAQDEARAVDARLSSLQVLLTYVDPGLYVSLEDLINPTPGKMLPGTAHSRPKQGSMAPGPNMPNDVYDFLGQLAQGASDRTVARAAAYLRQGVTDQMPELGIKLASGLRLTYVCGVKFRIENSGEVDLIVALASAGPQTHELKIGARSVKDVSAAAGPGPLRLLYAGQTVSQATPTGRRCP